MLGGRCPEGPHPLQTGDPSTGNWGHGDPGGSRAPTLTGVQGGSPLSVLPIRMLGDPVLREPSRDVEAFDELMHRLYEDMLETMYHAPGVGLAAPQIGLSLRLFVFDPGPEHGTGPGAVANPVLSYMDGEQTDEEGGLSIPNLYLPTTRA